MYLHACSKSRHTNTSFTSSGGRFPSPFFFGSSKLRSFSQIGGSFGCLAFLGSLITWVAIRFSELELVLETLEASLSLESTFWEGDARVEVRLGKEGIVATRTILPYLPFSRFSFGAPWSSCFGSFFLNFCTLTRGE